ncbi:unnamed protein product [Trichogramma brassicae]|uniref:Uncharacterized protein n=1 Tax=Trichogramma brassicae TaxID=86971 RepID=A0A6H5IL66_9HYME|nr:unnamed protein product [Trichogramma brassicae]
MTWVKEVAPRGWWTIPDCDAAASGMGRSRQTDPKSELIRRSQTVKNHTRKMALGGEYHTHKA